MVRVGWAQPSCDSALLLQLPHSLTHWRLGPRLGPTRLLRRHPSLANDHMRTRFIYALPVFAGYVFGAFRDSPHQQTRRRRRARRRVPCPTLDPSHRGDTTETAIKMRNSWCPWLMSSSGKYWHPIYSSLCCLPMLLSRHRIITGGDSCGWLAGYTTYRGTEPPTALGWPVDLPSGATGLPHSHFTPVGTCDACQMPLFPTSPYVRLWYTRPSMRP
jgi:hypothetical protein